MTVGSGFGVDVVNALLVLPKVRGMAERQNLLAEYLEGRIALTIAPSAEESPNSASFPATLIK
ncbi:MAG: hypothetical protein IPP37_20350 [Saprospiraceae bacterium]|nr:hypothetical protein [Saprospiraceae bacterium]